MGLRQVEEDGASHEVLLEQPLERHGESDELNDFYRVEIKPWENCLATHVHPLPGFMIMTSLWRLEVPRIRHHERFSLSMEAGPLKRKNQSSAR